MSNIHDVDSIIHFPHEISEQEDVPYSVGTDLGNTIKKYRSEAEYSQQEFADLLGVSRNTVINWETDKCAPNFEMITRMCNELCVPPERLLNIKPMPSFDNHILVLIQEYCQLSQIGQNMVDKIIYSLLQEEVNAKDRALKEAYDIFEFQATRAAAGTGNLFTDVAPKFKFLRKNSINQFADTVVEVSGHSMEPIYQDGDWVYVKYTDSADPGEDVIATSDDGLVIKRLSDDRKLYSINPAFPYPPKNDDNSVHILGRVLGIVSSDDRPSLHDEQELESLKHEEVREFLNTHMQVEG